MRTHSAWRVVVCCVLAALCAACGNRLSDDEIRAQNAVTAKISSGGSGAASGSADGGASADAATAGGSTQDTASSAGGASAAGASGAAGSTGGASGGTQSTGGGKAPIVIGYIAWLSGFGGD